LVGFAVAAADDAGVRALSLLFTLVACGGGGGGHGAVPDASRPDAAAPLGDIADELRAIDGMSMVTEYDYDGPGYRFFSMLYTQPVDHDQPDGPTFSQMMTLIHRSYDAPTVLATTGYWNYLGGSRTEPTVLLDANQLVTEERFFSDSRPDPADWDKLRIRQAAADHHRIIAALKRRIYKGVWVSTGASKGGMTSIYHKRFYPDDVDAVIAYVAPISFGAPDDRYQAFFDTVGTSACRQRLHDFQRMALTRRDEIKPMIVDLVNQEGYQFSYSGGLDTAIEDEIAGLEWSFWQYMGTQFCNSIPQAGATAAAIYNFIDQDGGLTFSADRYVDLFMPYYFQADVELGYPGYEASYVQDLLLYKDVVRPDPLPSGFDHTYDPSAMADIADWVKHNGDDIMYIYGEYDPWFAGAFELGTTTNAVELVAAQATHGASISQLSSADRDTALSTIEAWTGVQPSFPAAFARPLPPRYTPRPPPWLLLRHAHR